MIIDATYFILVLVVSLVRPVAYIYYYLLIIYFEAFVVSYMLPIENPQLFVFSLGGSIPFRLINQLGLFIMAAGYPLRKGVLGMNRNHELLKRTLRFVVWGILGSAGVLTLNAMVYGQITNAFVKWITYILPLILILNITYFFPSNKDKSNLYQRFFNLTLLVFFLFAVIEIAPHIQKNTLLDEMSRLEHYLYFGANSTAAFLGLFLMLTLEKATVNRELLFKIVWYIMSLIILISIIYTYTRTIFFALALVFIIDSFMMGRSRWRLILFSLFAPLVMFVFWEDIVVVLSRGSRSQDILSLNNSDSGTFAFRVIKLWLPSLIAIVSDLRYFLIGTPDKGFNEFLVRMSGFAYASHNTFLNYLVASGVLGFSCFAIFWRKLFQDLRNLLSLVRKEVLDVEIKFRIYSVLIWFISILFMSSYHFIFVTQFAVIIASMTSSKSYGSYRGDLNRINQLDRSN